MVDELANEIVTIPMCLREDGTQGFCCLRPPFRHADDLTLLGFPPPDKRLRNYLLDMGTEGPDKAMEMLDDFIASLLSVTYQRLKKMVHGDNNGDIVPILRMNMLTMLQIP